MKTFMQKLGIIAASGLVFGVLAGVSFVGTKSGVEYAKDIIQEQFAVVADGKDIQKEENGNQGDETRENHSQVTVGNTETVTVSLNEESQLYNVADLAEEVMPSIVSITSTVIYQNPYAYFFGGSSEQTMTGCGSGIIIGEDEERLLIVTNNHVIEGSESLTVGFSDGTDAEAVIVGTATGNDLAVVAVQKDGLAKETLATVKLAQLGDSEATRVGEPVMAIGNALGYGQSVTVGYISALNKTININNSTINMLQTDAAINEGNSGGALFNLQGQLIGINSAKANNYNNNVEGMGYAIPISDALPIVQSIIDGTQSTMAAGSAYMGIQGRDLSARDALSFNMPEGVYLLAVIEGAPADEAGLQAGDIITAIDGTDITSMSDIKSILAGKEPGDTITVTYYRSDQRSSYSEQSTTVTLGNYVE